MAHPVTIITPVYNGAAFIEETLRSVLAQAYPDLEYIVVDDGSTDSTPEIVARFAPRVRVLRQRNSGEPAAVNTGIAAASNDVIAVVNADDPILPGLIEKACGLLADRPELVAVYPDWLCIDQHGATTVVMRTPDYDYRLMLEEHYCIPGPGTFFRRSAFGPEPVRSLEFPLNGDFDAWLRLGLTGPMQRIPEALATWRRHGQNTSTTQQTASMAAARIRLIEALFRRPHLPASVRELEAQALSAAYYFAAVIALHDARVPARRYLLESLRYKFWWPRRIAPGRRRSWKIVLYLLSSPASRPLKRLYGRYLRARGFRHDLGT